MLQTPLSLRALADLLGREVGFGRDTFSGSLARWSLANDKTCNGLRTAVLGLDVHDHHDRARCIPPKHSINLKDHLRVGLVGCAW